MVSVEIEGEQIELVKAEHRLKDIVKQQKSCRPRTVPQHGFNPTPPAVSSPGTLPPTLTINHVTGVEWAPWKTSSIWMDRISKVGRISTSIFLSESAPTLTYRLSEHTWLKHGVSYARNMSYFRLEQRL
jgi:hypothetical protein